MYYSTSDRGAGRTARGVPHAGAGGQLHVADWGKPPNLVLRAMFYAVQLPDGFANTRDNVQGRLGRFFEEAGFKEVSMPARVNTPLGTIALYRAKQP